MKVGGLCASVYIYLDGLIFRFFFLCGRIGKFCVTHSRDVKTKLEREPITAVYLIAVAQEVQIHRQSSTHVYICNTSKDCGTTGKLRFPRSRCLDLYGPSWGRPLFSA